jgi:hypothetical protein
MQEPAYVDERPRNVDRQVAAEALRLDLGRLAETLGIQERTEQQRQQTDDEASGG